ncbi:MFS transporter [Alicyclobacillus fastidiosus]|uniref:MFS transporter n=1 Tax=Alicyclobacillus fastidiosus TaxID=392011 RepID=A0ABV5AC44_9BACL|nr:MFS transporter [Alicyclobacillus fastidiosus]WEH11462.1 MFS transporter [Alicyclobacillus fastidiosus]
MDKQRSTLALLALAVSAFAIGTTEFISVGLLPLISKGMHVSVTTAGLTVTVYALGVTLGAPILTPLTASVPRKALLLWIMVLFIVGNGTAAMATSMEMLLVGRVLAALAHGVFMAIASTLAADVASEDRRASAIAFMFTGLTVATVTGVPLGTFLGHQLGWRVAFMMIVAFGIVALVANSILVPSNLPRGARPNFSHQFAIVTNRRLLLMFIITALGYGGTFVVFTYLSPLLQDVTGFRGATVAAILLVYGIAIAIGNFIGGRLANRRPLSALLYMFVAQAVVLAILSLTAPFKVAALVTIFGMGLLAFMNVPGLQVYVVQLAERFAPKAVDAASALNIAAFNAGIALGAYLGGIVARTLGLIHTPWIGALMVLAAAILTGWSCVLERKDEQATEAKRAYL